MVTPKPEKENQDLMVFVEKYIPTKVLKIIKPVYGWHDQQIVSVVSNIP